MSFKIVSQIPKGVWWVIAFCVLLVTFTVCLMLLAADTAKISAGGVTIEASGAAPSEPLPDEPESVILEPPKP
jgi:hypothetical protein